MSPRSFFDSHTKFLCDRMNVGNLKVDECVWPRIAFVFRQEQFHRSAFDGHKSRKSRLESVDRRLLETKPLIPRDANFGILNVKYRDYFLFHCGRYRNSYALLLYLPRGSSARHASIAIASTLKRKMPGRIGTILIADSPT